MEFKDKVVLITGASRGIGASTAKHFAEKGAQVIINYHPSKFEENAKENAERVLKSIEEKKGKGKLIQADISKEKEVEKMMSEIKKDFGTLDILVNNAGVVYDLPFSETTAEQWREVLDVNLVGTFICSKAASKIMKKGKIINLSSTNGINCFFPDSMAYDSSKAGVILLTKNLAQELAPNILVNAVAPGWVNTEMNEDLPQEVVNEETEKIYLKRFAEPEEIAKVILFLASNDANYITGSILKVDGGYQ
jgi:3-oxoacyl-[acyl-carrier protein] reductase